MRILKQSQSAEKLEREDPLGFLKLQFAAKYQNICRRDLLATEKNFRKVAQCRKKLKPYSLVLFCFVSYDKNGVTERGCREKFKGEPYNLVRFCILL